jgi:hypothetical protein
MILLNSSFVTPRCARKNAGSLSGVLAAPLSTGYLSAPAPDAATVAPAVDLTFDWGDTTGSGPIGAVGDTKGATGWITSVT